MIAEHVSETQMQDYSLQDYSFIKSATHSAAQYIIERVTICLLLQTRSGSKEWYIARQVHGLIQHTFRSLTIMVTGVRRRCPMVTLLFDTQLAALTTSEGFTQVSYS